MRAWLVASIILARKNAKLALLRQARKFDAQPYDTINLSERSQLRFTTLIQTPISKRP